MALAAVQFALPRRSPKYVVAVATVMYEFEVDPPNVAISVGMVAAAYVPV